jgi:hypothetical protein
VSPAAATAVAPTFVLVNLSTSPRDSAIVSRSEFAICVR